MASPGKRAGRDHSPQKSFENGRDPKFNIYSLCKDSLVKIGAGTKTCFTESTLHLITIHLFYKYLTHTKGNRSTSQAA